MYLVKQEHVLWKIILSVYLRVWKQGILKWFLKFLRLSDMQSYGHLWLWVVEFVFWAVEVEKNKATVSTGSLKTKTKTKLHTQIKNPT